MAFRFLHNAFLALVDLGHAVEDATFGRRRRNARNARLMHQDDVEMDMMTAWSASHNVNDNHHRPMPEFSLIREFVNGIRFTGLRRSTTLNDARDVTFMTAILAILAFFMLLGLVIVPAVTWLAEPVGMTSRDLGAHNWHKFDNLSSVWSAQYNRSAAISHADPVFVPGFYMYSPQDDASNSIWQTSPVVADTPAVRGVCEAATTQELVATEEHMVERHSSDTHGPFHHAYPLHAGRTDHSEHTNKARDQLLNQNSTIVECEWKRPVSRITGRSCSKDFCGWVANTNLDRCYHMNKTRFQQDGTKSYLNESVDDFKDNAPLECNLCLPRRDCDGIDEHCAGVENRTNNILLNLGIFATFLLLGTTVVASVHTWRRWRLVRRQGRETAVDPQNVEDTELSDWDSTMPRE